MDFARRQLEKYGWSDGKGLGKDENGIVTALKTKLKRSVTGIGHDSASDFTEHWWSALYDKAAGNIKIKEKNGKTKRIKTKDEADFEISNSMWKIKKNPKIEDSNTEHQYSDFFVKKAVLTSGGSKTEKVNDSDSEEEKDTKDVFKMTDEELFAACEGRTAHKGARHGLRALGKLARIEQQEQKLLNLPQYEGYSHTENNKKERLSVGDDKVIEDTNFNTNTEITYIKKKKKKRKRCHSHEIVNCVAINENKTNIGLADSMENLFGKIKKRKKRNDDNVASNIDHKTCSRKFKQREKIEAHSNHLNEQNVDITLFKKKRSAENESLILEIGSAPVFDFEQNSEVVTKKFKKKNKKKKEIIESN